MHLTKLAIKTKNNNNWWWDRSRGAQKYQQCWRLKGKISFLHRTPFKLTFITLRFNDIFFWWCHFSGPTKILELVHF